jgi:hypothetical protein
MTVDSKDGTVVRGADGALYVVSTDICQRAAQALNTGFGSGNTSTGTLRFAKSKDHASARAFVDPGGRPRLGAGLRRSGRPRLGAGLRRSGRPRLGAGLRRSGRLGSLIPGGFWLLGSPELRALSRAGNVSGYAFIGTRKGPFG